MTISVTGRSERGTRATGTARRETPLICFYSGALPGTVSAHHTRLEGGAACHSRDSPAGSAPGPLRRGCSGGGRQRRARSGLPAGGVAQGGRPGGACPRDLPDGSMLLLSLSGLLERWYWTHLSGCPARAGSRDGWHCCPTCGGPDLTPLATKLAIPQKGHPRVVLRPVPSAARPQYVVDMVLNKRHRTRAMGRRAAAAGRAGRVAKAPVTRRWRRPLVTGSLVRFSRLFLRHR
jgi:hypothetical protein